MMVFIHTARELGISDDVPVIVEDEKVWTTDNHDGGPVNGRFVREFRLINHGNKIADGFKSPRTTLSSLNGTDVLVSPQRGEMFFLMNVAESLNDLVKGTGLRLLYTFRPQVQP